MISETIHVYVGWMSNCRDLSRIMIKVCVDSIQSLGHSSCSWLHYYVSTLSHLEFTLLGDCDFFIWLLRSHTWAIVCCHLLVVWCALWWLKLFLFRTFLNLLAKVLTATLRYRVSDAVMLLWSIFLIGKLCYWEILLISILIGVSCKFYSLVNTWVAWKPICF